MRILITTFAAIITCSATAFANGEAAKMLSESGPDPLTPLYAAEYISASEVTAHMPHGDVYLVQGVVAAFPGLSEKLSGMLIGDLEFIHNALPSGEGTLDLFAEMDERAHSRVVKVKQAYLTASYGSGTYIEPSGYATEVRSWDELSPDEQEQFKSIYLQCYSDGFIVEQQHGGMGGHWAGGGAAAPAPVVELRNPVAKEVFAAYWDDEGQRYDYRVNADATEITIKDYYRGIMMYQSPWTPEEGELDENVVLDEIRYNYNLFPSTEDSEDLDELGANAIAKLEVLEDANSIFIVSAPWMEWDQVAVHVKGVGENTVWRDVPWQRGGDGRSSWMIEIQEPFKAGTDHTIMLDGHFEIPETYSAAGYGGVYRFDTTAMWPGETNPAKISISLALVGHGWSMIPSDDPEVSEAGREVSLEFAEVPEELRDRTMMTATWRGNTRNQMIAATQFPKRELVNDWGTLEVYAPAELIDSVHETDYVSAVGDMMEYYTSLWGDWQGEGAGTDRQLIFLLPDETGVQAFENAGFVFILGGSRTGIPLVSHEVAHLWWGQGFSGPRWFGEGMANYGAAKFLEYYRNKYGIDDPLFYRRYVLNFSLGHELPLSMERRDEMDDSAAIYHNSAGFLLTADNRLPYGLDGILQRIYTAGLNMPYVDHEELREIMRDQSEDLGALWDRYIEDGIIDVSEVDDETYRELVHTPARDDYTTMLHWLTPAYQKSAIGDYPGAIYCAERALDYRNEPKDYLMIADLCFKAGRIGEAMERATIIMEDQDPDPQVSVKTTYLFAKIFRKLGDTVNEKAALESVVADGPAANLMYQVQAAQQRLDEINAGE